MLVSINMINLWLILYIFQEGTRNKPMNKNHFLLMVLCKPNIMVSEVVFARRHYHLRKSAPCSITGIDNSRQALDSTKITYLVESFITMNIFPNFIHNV